MHAAWLIIVDHLISGFVLRQYNRLLLLQRFLLCLGNKVLLLRGELLFTGSIRHVDDLMKVVSSDRIGDSLDLPNSFVLHHGLKVGINTDKVILAVLRLILVVAPGVAVAIDVVRYIFTWSREHAQELAHSLILVLHVISSITVIVSKRCHISHEIRFFQLSLLVGNLVSAATIEHGGSVEVARFLVVRNVIKASTTILRLRSLRRRCVVFLLSVIIAWLDGKVGIILLSVPTCQLICQVPQPVTPPKHPLSFLFPRQHGVCRSGVLGVAMLIVR